MFRISGFNGSAIGFINIQFSNGNYHLSKSSIGTLTYTKFLYKETDDYYYIYITGTNESYYSHSYWDFWSSEKEIDLNIDHTVVLVETLGATSF